MILGRENDSVSIRKIIKTTSDNQPSQSFIIASISTKSVSISGKPSLAIKNIGKRLNITPELPVEPYDGIGEEQIRYGQRKKMIFFAFLW